jgi:Flp pilus assembly protein TadG
MNVRAMKPAGGTESKARRGDLAMSGGIRARIGRHRERRGASAAELALLLPMLLFLLVGAADFCRLFYAYTTITNAARNGALWLADPLASTSSPYATFQAAALADANGLNPALTASNVTSTTGTDGEGNATVSVTVQYAFRMFTSYLGFSSVTLARQVTMRVAPSTPS